MKQIQSSTSYSINTAFHRRGHNLGSRRTFTLWLQIKSTPTQKASGWMLLEMFMHCFPARLVITPQISLWNLFG